MLPGQHDMKSVSEEIKGWLASMKGWEVSSDH